MYKIFLFLEHFTDVNKLTKIKKIIRFIFCPIFLFLEYIIYLYYWKNLVVKEFFTNDVIVDFLDKNEFGYNGKKIEKADLLSTNPFYDRIDLDSAKHIIKKEFVETISNLIQENISINLEDFITLIVTTEIKIIQNNGENFRDKIYTVTLQFCRLYFLRECFQRFLYWIITFSTILLSWFLFLNQLIIIK